MARVGGVGWLVGAGWGLGAGGRKVVCLFVLCSVYSVTSRVCVPLLLLG